MKKTLLLIGIVASSFVAQSQVLCKGISPAGIAGTYNFEWADPAGGDWSTPDFTIPGTFVEDTLAWAEDGTPGTSTYGHPLSKQACNALDPGISDVNGKIAILYRGDCQFGTKALNAQNAGAVAVIIINHTGDAVGMAGGNDGASVTIPVIMVGEADGAILAAAMATDDVVMFIGNKQNLYATDMGALQGEMIVSDYGGAHSALYDGFTPGIQIYNFGSNANTVAVVASISSPGGTADYTSTVGPVSLNSGDTLSIFAGNPEEFTAWALGVGNYPNGEYTLTYDIQIAGDQDPSDNQYSYTFWVNDNNISLSNLDASDMPVANSYPFNAATDYKACMMFQEPNASAVGVQGMYFIPYTDTAAGFTIAGAEVLLYAYQWNDAWTDVTNPGFTSFSEYVQDLVQITGASYNVGSDDDIAEVAYAEFATPFILQDNVRYLFCLESTDIANELAFGYDNTMDYDGNYGIYLQPISPVQVDATWYTGWSGLSAPSMALKTFDPAELGVEATEMIEGSAYPNPAVDVVTINVAANGAANLQVTDISGKVAFNNAVTLVNGRAQVNIESLEAGLYIFNVTLENGQTSQFNVVKK